MDSLRTQKIRYLTDLYREMKVAPMDKCSRIELIDKIDGILNDEEKSKSLDEVGTKLD